MPGFSMLETSDPLTGRTLRTCRHESGMIVKILPRPGFYRRFAALAIPFGSTHGEWAAGSETLRVPAGTAHFLEHCLFSRDEAGGLAGRLAEWGAAANAYTAHDHTLYYFATTGHFQESLDLFLEAILQPDLEPDRVAAEKPIILAELAQYQDDPDTRCYLQLLQNLYLRHPVREDIGGSPSAVQAIVSADLKNAWRCFYQLPAMTLTLAGDFDAEPILRLIAGKLERASRGSIAPARPIWPPEPPLPVKTTAWLNLDVGAPSFLVGFKDPWFSQSAKIGGRERAVRQISGRELVTRQIAGRLLLGTLLSPSAPLYDSLYGEHLVNDSFGYHYVCEESYAYLVCGGESPDPEMAAAAVRDRLVSQFNKGPDAELFETQKRVAAGDYVRSLDSVEHSGLVEAQSSLYGLDLFDYPAVYDKMDLATASRVLKFLADPSSCSIATIHQEVKVST